MYIRLKFNKAYLAVLLSSIFFLPISWADDTATIYFSGTVANGTCEFDADSDQEVIFDEPFSGSVLSALEPGEESDYRKSFMVEYTCEGSFPEGVTTIDMIITPLNGTEIYNNVLYSDEDVNVGFLLMDCGDEEDGTCEEIEFSGNEASVETGSGEHYFEVVAAKVDNQPILTGDVDAAIELSLQVP